jgi:hypothetical protein
MMMMINVMKSFLYYFKDPGHEPDDAQHNPGPEQNASLEASLKVLRRTPHALWD